MSALLCVLVFLALNIVTVKMFGELEFWFAIIKIVAIVALIVTGIVLVAMHYPSPAAAPRRFRISGITVACSRKD